MSRLNRLWRDERGFTLVEMVMSSAISALVIGTIVVALWQFNLLTRQQRDALTISTELSNVGTVLNHDLVTAASATVSEDGRTLTVLIPQYSYGEDTEPVTRTVSYQFLPIEHQLLRSESGATRTLGKSLSMVDFGEPGPVPSAMSIALTATSYDGQGNTSQTTSLALEISRRVGTE